MLVGLDVLRRGRNHPARRRIQDQSIALLSHHAALDEHGVPIVRVLTQLEIDVRLVLTPEHGFDGVAEAEQPILEDDAELGERRVVSLYGANKESLSPSAATFDGIDTLVVDVVDVGARYYTYVWTALLAARAAADAGVHVLLLDRPNPLGTHTRHLEGRPQDPELCSFVGLRPIPTVHCLTVGELIVSCFNEEERPMGPDGALSVVPVEGWERHRTAEAWGRPFVAPSPNMPTLQTALVYPGGCLLEGTNLSEGRGTTLPFQQLGAPYLRPGALAQAVGEVPGAWTRPTRFIPHFDKHAGQVCNGVMIQVTDEARFRPVETYLRVLDAARRLAPDDFEFLTRPYEFESEELGFDLLTGHRRVRELLIEGAPVDEVVRLACSVDEEWETRVEAAEELVDEVRA